MNKKSRKYRKLHPQKTVIPIQKQKFDEPSSQDDLADTEARIAMRKMVEKYINNTIEFPLKSNALVEATITALNNLGNHDDKNIKVGDEVYVDTSLYTTHGADDFIGGLCKISSVRDMGTFLRIEVEEDPGVSYPWPELEKQQESLKRQFGNKRGHKRPDHREEFNRQ